LGDEPDAARRARRHTDQVISSTGRAELVDLSYDAQLVVSELVTNARLHGAPPIVVVVRCYPDGVRIQVADATRIVPMRGIPSKDSMTGRGIALVKTLARCWGVEGSPEGKVVWCELGVGEKISASSGWDVDVDPVLQAWVVDPAADEAALNVHLGDVPTNLLIAAKAHVDNVIREFALAAGGAQSQTAAAVPPRLAEVIDRVSQRFVDPRRAIKRQAQEASRRGDRRTDLTLTLTPSSAEDGEAYLAALDEVDAYARAARILTLETPPQHRAFRQWYVRSLIAQLRAGSAHPTTMTVSFERWLLDELDVVASSRRAVDRAARLQAVTAALASAVSVEEVDAVVVTQGATALGASSGIVLMGGQDRLIVPAVVGADDELVDHIQAERLDADLPAAVALRTGRPVWLESRPDRDERFPELNALEPSALSMCAVPLIFSGQTIGALRFSFDTYRLFDTDERAFVLALAAQTAQVMERSRLYAAEREARRSAEAQAARLARLQRVTTELTAARDVEHIADIIVTHLADALGAPGASLSLAVDDSTLEVVRLRGVEEHVHQRWRTYPISAALPGSEAVRTGRPVVVHDAAERRCRFPGLAAQADSDNAFVCLPLLAGKRPLGVVSLSFPSPHALDDGDELGFLTTLAETCAQALQRADALERARVATDKLAFLAEASAELAVSLDYQSTLRNVARLIVPRLADWCAIQTVEDGAYSTIAVAHTDPAKVAWAQRLQERYPVDPQASTGVPQVLRSGISELYPDVTDEMLVAGAIDEEHLRLTRELGLSSILIVPLTGRCGTYGTITMIYAESGRHYDRSDLSLAEDMAGRVAVAIENARAYERQTGQLAAVTRIAEAAQHAILAPIPARLGSVALTAKYISAAAAALIGGDLYEVIELPGAVRIIIGDVRGKGLDAVRMATVALGHFRSAAVDCQTLPEVARRMDSRIRPYLGDEDFVTALLAEIREDGTCHVVSCGHPPALLASADRLTAVGQADSTPLGLGAAPAQVTVTLAVGDRLLLYTDGILEARRPDRSFVELPSLLGPLSSGDLHSVLARVLAALRTAVGDDLGDDLAMLVAEYSPE